VIELEDISFGYTSNPILRNISLKIDNNELISLTGPNGSGKTTLALLLAGILEPQGGEVVIDSIRSNEYERFEEKRKDIGIVFENPDNQFITTSVERELAFGLENMGVEREEMKRRVEESIKRFSLEELRFRAPHTLSGGEKQKVAIASILIFNPRYLILDEPTAFLDPCSRRMVLDLIQNLKGTISILLISHFPEEIMLGDTIYFLRDGKLDKQEREKVVLRSQSLDFLHFLNERGISQYLYPPEPEMLCDTIEAFKKKKSTRV